MKATIIGHKGFVGKNLIDILKKTVEIRGLSKSTGFNLEKAFFSDEQVSILKNCDFIINCAANVGSLNYVSEQAADVLDSNTRIIINLYKTLRNISSKAVVINPIANCGYPGSLALYREEEFWNGPIHDSVLSYGTSRRFLVTISRCYEKQYGIKSLNYFVPNMYGENDSVDSNKAHALNALINKFYIAAKHQKPEVTVWGTGKPVREWLYAKDFAKIILQTMKRYIDGETFSESINIGQKYGISITDLVKIIVPIVNYSGQVIYDTSKQDGAPVKIMDNKLFIKKFPDFHFTSFQEGITNTLHYYTSILSVS